MFSNNVIIIFGCMLYIFECKLSPSILDNFDSESKTWTSIFPSEKRTGFDKHFEYYLNQNYSSPTTKKSPVNVKINLFENQNIKTNEKVDTEPVTHSVYYLLKNNNYTAVELTTEYFSLSGMYYIVYNLIFDQFYCL